MDLIRAKVWQDVHRPHLPGQTMGCLATVTWIVVMGVSGCGKSHVGALIAEALGLPLVEGDDFHSAENRALMREGVPLTDANRAGWLDALSAELRARASGAVLTCSALKTSYRDRLRAAVPGLRFVWLELDAQSAPVGEPLVLRLDALEPPEVLAERVAQWIASDPSGLDSSTIRN
jgi:gluconokinase